MKNKKTVDKKKIEEKINAIPYFIVWILMIIIAPIGVWFFLIKKSNDKKQVYNKSRTLMWCALFILFLIGIGLYSKIKEIIVLYESGMSLDMINFFPDKLYLYIIGTIICVSFIIGSKKLMMQAKKEQIYTKSINIDNEESIEKIGGKLGLSTKEAKDNIELLSKYGRLIPIKIDSKNNKIIYNVASKKENTKVLSKKLKNNRTVKCSKCGAIVFFKLDEYVECDFCGHGLIDEGNN